MAEIRTMIEQADPSIFSRPEAIHGLKVIHQVESALRRRR
jgi:hypothetical protein